MELPSSPNQLQNAELRGYHGWVDPNAVRSPKAPLEGSPKRRLTEISSNIPSSDIRKHRKSSRFNEDQFTPLIGSPLRLKRRTTPAETTIGGINKPKSAQCNPTRRTVAENSVFAIQKESLCREIKTLKQNCLRLEEQVSHLQAELRWKTERLNSQDPKKERLVSLLTEEKDQLNTKLRESMAINEKSRRDLERIALALENDHTELERRNSKLESISRSYNELSSQHQDLQDKYANIQTSLEKKDDRIATLMAFQEEMTFKRNQNTQEIVELQEKMTTVTKKCSSLESEKLDFLHDMKMLQASKQSSENRCEQLCAELDRVKQEFDNTLQNNANEYELRVSQLQTKLELKYDKLISEIRNEQLSSQKYLEENETQLKRLTLKCDVLTTENNKLQTANDRLKKTHEEEMQAMFNHLDGLKGENWRQTSNVSEMCERLREADVKILQLQEINNSYETAMNEQREELTRARRDIVSLNIIQSKHESSSKHTMNKTYSMLQDLDERYKNICSSNEAHIQKLSDEVKRLQHELTESLRQLKSTEYDLQLIKREKEQLDTQELVNTEYTRIIAKLKEQAESETKQLMEEREIVRKLQNQIQDLKGSIRIVARVRPPVSTNDKGLTNLTLGQCHIMLAESETAAIGVERHKTLKVPFDRVFGPGATNESIAEETEYIVQSALDGRNVCILAYGQTGSGKTWTMSGADGISMHALHKIMQTASKPGQLSYKVSVEAIEIYNEQLRDLLKEHENRTYTTGFTTSLFSANELSIQQNPATGQPALSGAKRVVVSTEKEAQSLLSKAMQQRSTAATAANQRSSRSHFVFTVHIEKSTMGSVSGGTSHGVLHLVDLAGSERFSHALTTGDRAKETRAINTSLSALGNVINALLNKRPTSHIPYRSSKLTYLLQGSLCGDAKTMLLTALSPEASSIEETKSTLRFAETASRATLK